MTKIIEREIVDVLNDLPEHCMMRDMVSGDPIIVYRGSTGYYPTHPSRDPERYNKPLGITPAQVEAMRAGSHFGFDVPGADPLNNQDAEDMA